MSTGTPDLSITIPEAATLVAVGAVSYGSYKWLNSCIRSWQQSCIAKQAIKDATQAMQKRLEELDRRKEDFPQLYLKQLESDIFRVKWYVTETPRARTAWRSELLEREALALESRLNAWIQEEDTAPVSEGLKLAK